MSESSYFDEFYVKWSRTVTKTCLPLFAYADPASIPSGNINSVLRILDCYYETLNSHAKNDSNTIPYFLFPSWRKSLETPILFLGDIHPYLLTRLIRSLISRANQDSGETASKDPHVELLKKIEELEDEIGTNISDLLARMSKAQLRFADRFSDHWVSSHHSQEKIKRKKTFMKTAASMAVDDSTEKEMKDLVSIFVDANLVRKFVIRAIVEATRSDHTLAALFLECLCRFYSVFKDQGREFQSSLSASLNHKAEPVTSPNHTVPVMNQLHTPKPVHLTRVPSNDRTLWMADVTNSGLFHFECAQAGSVVSANIVRCRDKETGQIKYFGKIVFGTWPSANRALQLYNNTIIPYVYPVQVYKLSWCSKRSEYTIFVGNLNGDITPYLLGEMFRVHYQSVRATKVAVDSDTGRCRGYGFVSFLDKNEQIRAMGEMDGLSFANRFIKIGPASGVHIFSPGFSSCTWD